MMLSALCSSRRGLGTGPASFPAHRQRSRWCHESPGKLTLTAEWPSPQARSVVASRGLQLSVCEWGDVASASLVLVGAHGYLDCAEFFAPLGAAPAPGAPRAARRLPS